MKIKIKLQLIIIFSALALLGILFTNLYRQQQTEKQFKQQALTMELNQAIFNENQIREKYFFYHEGRSKEQFLLIHEKIGGIFKRMLGSFAKAEEKIYLEKMAGLHDQIGRFFDDLADLTKNWRSMTPPHKSMRRRPKDAHKGRRFHKCCRTSC